jgi:hypothetical protein
MFHQSFNSVEFAGVFVTGLIQTAKEKRGAWPRMPPAGRIRGTNV